MNILRNDIDAVNATITIQVVEADYAEKVEKTLKEYRKKANIPGFRPGMTPMGLVKKMYGRSIKAEEMNKLLQDSLYNYISENKLDILGEPLPNEEDENANDFDNGTEFEFKFDIALAPEFEPELSDKDSVNFYNINVNDEMIENQVKNYAGRYGSYTQVDEAVEMKDMLKGQMVEVDAEGTIVEGGITVEDATLAAEYIKDEEQKAIFSNSKKNSVVVFNPKKAFENETEISSMLKITKEEAAELTANFQFEIQSITHYTESPIDQSLFDKVYGEGTVATEEEFRAKVAEGIAGSYKEDSEYKFGLDVKTMMVAKMADLVYPEAFLKRWVLATNEKMTEESVEKDFHLMLEDLKWYVCKNKLAQMFELKVEKEDISAFARRMTRIQFAQYGMTSVPDDILENYSTEMLKNQDTVRNLAEKALEDKVYNAVREKVTIVDNTISVEEFNKMFEEQN